MRDKCDIQKDLDYARNNVMILEQELADYNRTYHIGQWFISDKGEKAILAEVSPYNVVLICTGYKRYPDGNRWRDPVQVENVRQITQQEFDKIAGVGWTPIDPPEGLY